MALEYRNFAIYSLTGGTAAARPCRLDMGGTYDPEGIEPDDRPVAGIGYDAATEGWIPVEPFTWAAPADDTQQIELRVDTTVSPGIVSQVPVAAPISLRQNGMMGRIWNLIDAVRWTQAQDAKITPACRLAFKRYREALAAIPTAQAATWASSPETVALPTAPAIEASAQDTGVLSLVDASSDQIDVPWTADAAYSAHATAITYPTGVAGATGDGALRVTAQGVLIRSPILVRYNPARLYRAVARVQRETLGASPGFLRLGIQPYDASGAALGSPLWPVTGSAALAQASLTQGAWAELSGYAKGYAGTPASNLGTVEAPTTLPVGTAMIGAAAIMNDNGSGTALASGGSTVLLDYLDLGPVDAMISGAQVAQNTLARSKMDFDLGSLAPEWLFEGRDLSQFQVSGLTVSFETTGANSGGSYLRITKTGAGLGFIRSIYENLVPIRRLARLTYAGDWRWQAGAWVSGGLDFYVTWHDETGGQLASPNHRSNVRGPTPVSPGGTWNPFDGRVTPPAGAVYAGLEIEVDAANPAGVSADVDNYMLRMTILGDGIEDGQIGTDHLTSTAATRLSTGTRSGAAVNVTSAGPISASAQEILNISHTTKAGATTACRLTLELGAATAGAARVVVGLYREVNGGAATLVGSLRLATDRVDPSAMPIEIVDSPPEGTCVYRWRICLGTNNAVTPQYHAAQASILSRWR